MDRQAQSLRHLLVLSLLLVGVLVGASMVTALEAGDKAPDFTLPSTMGAEISLSQFRGKQLVLIEFYAEDFTPT